jgi:hypothetical protein
MALSQSAVSELLEAFHTGRRSPAGGGPVRSSRCEIARAEGERTQMSCATRKPMFPVELSGVLELRAANRYRLQ